MGYNSTVVVLNDALDQIENDREFGAKLAFAIRKLSLTAPVDISAGNNMNAATAVETHHANGTAIVAVGGNYGNTLGYVLAEHGTDVEKIYIIKALAKSFGYRLVRETRKMRY